MRIVSEETFGPILTVERFTTEAEAIALGNDTKYGLAAGVRTSDQARGERVVRALRHGTVWLNDFGYYTASAEWGGFGQSGNGRELGPDRARGIPRDQAHLAQHRTPPAGLVQGLAEDGCMATKEPHADSGMEDFGYRESLDRSIGKFASFAAGVSYISILTGTFQLFYFGFGTAGPAYLWSWPMVFVGQMAVALCFMELAAKYPVAGSVYNWSKKLASRLVGWSSGWLMLTASIVTISAVALAYQLNLPRMWSGFQIIGDGSGPYDFAANAVMLGTVLIAFTTLVNALGVRLMARINSAGVFIELIAAVLIAIILALNIKRGPQIFFSTQGYGAGESYGYLGAFLDRVAGLPVCDVRVRHRQFVGRGDGRTSPHGAEGHRPRDPGVVRDRRSDPGFRGDGGAESAGPADRRKQRRPAVHRRAGDVGTVGQDLPGLHRRCRDGVHVGRPHRRHPAVVRDGARQRAAVRREARQGEPEDSDADHSGRRSSASSRRSSW